MEQAGQQEMRRILRVDLGVQPLAFQNVPSDLSDEHRLLEVMIRCVAGPYAFDGHARSSVHDFDIGARRRTVSASVFLCQGAAERVRNERYDVKH